MAMKKKLICAAISGALVPAPLLAQRAPHGGAAAMNSAREQAR
jgi:hypothetical protein